MCCTLPRKMLQLLIDCSEWAYPWSCRSPHDQRASSSGLIRLPRQGSSLLGSSKTLTGCHASIHSLRNCHILNCRLFATTTIPAAGPRWRRPALVLSWFKAYLPMLGVRCGARLSVSTLDTHNGQRSVLWVLSCGVAWVLDMLAVERRKILRPCRRMLSILGTQRMELAACSCLCTKPSGVKLGLAVG